MSAEPSKEAKAIEKPSQPNTDGTTGQLTREVALGKDGFELFPQPIAGDSLDPLNWSFAQKHIILAIVMSL